MSEDVIIAKKILEFEIKLHKALSPGPVQITRKDMQYEEWPEKFEDLLKMCAETKQE